MNYSFYCRTSKCNRLGYAPIELSIILEGKRCFINLPRKEKPTVFRKQMYSKQTNEIKEYINVQISLINSAITDILSLGLPLTVDSLRDYLKNGGVKLYTISNLFEDFITLLDKRSTYENLLKYLVVRDEFYAFIGNKDKVLTTVTNADIQGFYSHLCSVNKASTAAGKIAKLRSIFRFAIDNNHIQVNLFSNLRVIKPKPTIEYLTENEVDTLLQKDFGIDRLNNVKDLFLFQCGSGLAYSDMAHLTPSDIQVKDNVTYIKKCRQKTDIEYTAVLLPFAIDILRKYNYHLPILSNQKMNAYLGEIGVLCGLNKKLHSHLGRKTYATYLLNHNVNISVVSKCLGHANTNITQQVYAHLQTKTILNSVQKIFEPSIE